MEKIFYEWIAPILSTVIMLIARAGLIMVIIEILKK